MNRAEARRRLEDGTSFQFVGDKVLLRNVTLIEALRQMNDECQGVVAKQERGVPLEPTRVLAA